MEVMDMHRLVDDLPAEVVGSAIGHSALDASAGQPNGESMRVVVAAVVRLAAHEAASHFYDGRPAEFGAAYNQRLVEEPPGFQVLDEGGKRLIRIVGVLAMQLNIKMMVPGIALGVVPLHHANAALDQARRCEAAARRAALAVYLRHV